MYFDECQTLDELRAEYKRLALRFHPDLGGDTRTMQNINIEFDMVFNMLKNSNPENVRKSEVNETPGVYRWIIEELIKLNDIEIELCGCWLWIGGDTYTNREKLKGMGCRWSRSKKLWYWRHDLDGCPNSSGNYSMEQIRRKYGSQKIKTLNSDEEKKDKLQVVA